MGQGNGYADEVVFDPPVGSDIHSVIYTLPEDGM